MLRRIFWNTHLQDHIQEFLIEVRFHLIWAFCLRHGFFTWSRLPISLRFVLLEIIVTIWNLELNFQLLRYPIIIYKPLKTYAQSFWKSQKSVPSREIRFGLAICTINPFNETFSEEPLQTSTQLNFSTLLNLAINRSLKFEDLVRFLTILHFLALTALNSLFECKIENFTRITGLHLFFLFHHPIENKIKIFSGILLFSGFELFMVTTNQVFEDLWFDTILVELVCLHHVLLLFLGHAIMDNLLGNLWLRILTTGQSKAYLFHLALETVYRKPRTTVQVFSSIGGILSSEIRLGKEALNNRIHIAWVSKVLHSSVVSSEYRGQGLSIFQNFWQSQIQIDF